MKLLFIVFACLLVFSGCVFQRSHVASEAQTQMVGMSKKDLFLCAGAPASQETEGGLEFLTYDAGGDSVGVGGVKTHDRYCEVTFVLNKGVIQKVNYQGRTGGLVTRGEQCAFVVEKCIK